MIAIVKAEFNEEVTDSLLSGCTNYLAKQNAGFRIYSVPGAVETVGLTQQLLKTNNYDAIIILGAVIKGDTDHYTYVCQFVTNGISWLSTQSSCPIVFGILTTLTEEQAMERADENRLNLGASYAATALSMIEVYRSLK